MMTPIHKLLAAASVFVVGLSGTASADTYHHIDDLANHIARQTRLLQHEISAHYRHTPEYSHLVHDTNDLARLADHMHEVAHHHGSLAHLESDLRRLDSSFH